MKWFKKLTEVLKREAAESTAYNLLKCSGGCGRTIDAGPPRPNYNSKMLPLGLDGIPRYERYINLTGFTCDKCYNSENPEPDPPASNDDLLAA